MIPLAKPIQQHQITVNELPYFYTKQPFEITNILGTVTAVLQQYCITDKAGTPYKLYKTKEGNWYDTPETNPSIESTFLRALKSTIDRHENMVIE